MFWGAAPASPQNSARANFLTPKVLTHVAIYPSVEEGVSETLRGTEVVVGNFSAAWMTVLTLPEGTPDPGWTIKALPSPAVVQRMRTEYMPVVILV